MGIVPLDPLDGLIVGADSRIGSELLRKLTPHFLVTGTTRREVFQGRVYCDLADGCNLPAAKLTYFCAGMTKIKDCEAWPERAKRINLSMPVELAQAQIESGGKVVFLSSSAAVTRRGTVYGDLKAEAERQFLAMGENAAVVRFGPVEAPGRQCHADGQYNPVSLDWLAGDLARFMEHWTSGLHIFHAHGMLVTEVA